jgi:hypothetical protein
VLLALAPARSVSPDHVSTEPIDREDNSSDTGGALAALHRREVLATEREIRQHLLGDLTQLGQLEEWSHPDVTGGERASQSETFRQLAEALVSGDFNSYRPTGKPNTHWRHWPDAGTL